MDGADVDERHHARRIDLPHALERRHGLPGPPGGGESDALRHEHVEVGILLLHIGLDEPHGLPGLARLVEIRGQQPDHVGVVGIEREGAAQRSHRLGEIPRLPL